MRADTIGLVGLTPMLAVSMTLITGLATGAICLAVLVLTSMTVSVFRPFIPFRLKSLYLLLITSTWVTIIDLILQACLYPVRTQLGFYIFILAMNTSLLYYLEESELRNKVLFPPGREGLRGMKESGLAAFKTGLAVAAFFTVFGAIREITARGGALTDVALLSFINEFNSIEPTSIFNTGLDLFNTTAGAFILFGLLLAAFSRYHLEHPEESSPS